MSKVRTQITSLPTRYEPLMTVFGEKASTTFVQSDTDLQVFKRLLTSARGAGQGKIMFLSALSGTGKSTFIHSVKLFLPDDVGDVVRLPPPHELSVGKIPQYLANLPKLDKTTVVNFDGREAPYFNLAEYQTFLGALNGLLRSRGDLLIIWPVTDEDFAGKLIKILEQVGGLSAFGMQPLYTMKGLPKEKYNLVLEKILQIANWQLEDAAVTNVEVTSMLLLLRESVHFWMHYRKKSQNDSM